MLGTEDAHNKRFGEMLGLDVDEERRRPRRSQSRRPFENTQSTNAIWLTHCHLTVEAFMSKTLGLVNASFIEGGLLAMDKHRQVATRPTVRVSISRTVSPRQRLLQEMTLYLGCAIIDVELDPVHFEFTNTAAFDRYRQHSGKPIVLAPSTRRSSPSPQYVCLPTCSPTAAELAHHGDDAGRVFVFGDMDAMARGVLTIRLSDCRMLRG